MWVVVEDYVDLEFVSILMGSVTEMKLLIKL